MLLDHHDAAINVNTKKEYISSNNFRQVCKSLQKKLCVMERKHGKSVGYMCTDLVRTLLLSF